ncbi:hypothetical protein P3T73_18290 [Kiritimatiellota bacterium B12222]|nr:hypothetical protein P3T73_18290 [Kiritimatiellota bacterium B12222]
MKNNKPLTIAVTGVSATENPGPGIGVAKSLRQWGGDEICLVALAYDASECLALSEGLFDHVFLMPYPGQGVESSLDRLEEIHTQLPLDVLIPCLDVEIPLFLKAQDRLDALGIRVGLPTPQAYQLRNKERLATVCAEWGIQFPKTVVVHHPSEILTAVEGLDYPLFVKGNQYGAKKVYTLLALQQAVEQVTMYGGYPVMFQQVIQGTDMLLAGLGDGQGGAVCRTVSLRKEHQTSQGKLWNAITIQCPWLQDVAEKFLAQSEWKGPFELECILGDDGSKWLIEINPRFPAWIYAGALLGVNLPACWLGQLFGQPERVMDLIPAGKWIVRSIQESVLDQDPMKHLLTQGSYCHAENI